MGELKPKSIPVDVTDPPGQKFVKVCHKCKKSMTDGKAKMACTDTASSLTCFLCKATPTAFNKLDNFPEKFPTNQKALEEFGAVSNMHAWERAFDALNHLSDKLTVDKWRVTKADDKAEVQQRKADRQKQMDDAFGLKVDVPLAGGCGNSNTGNTARTAFQSADRFADILGVDRNLVHRIHTMLVAINADIHLDAEAFRQYGRDTAELWIQKYPKFYMSVSLHQLFIHGWESLRHSPLPLTFFSEQSLESCNKTFKHDRRYHARKTSRLHTITDQFDR